MKRVIEDGWKGFLLVGRGIRFWGVCLGFFIGWVGVALPAGAQTAAAAPAPASAASAPAKGAAPSERAQRQADSVFRWIKIHSEKPRKAAEAKPAAKSEAAVVVTGSSPREAARAEPDDAKPAPTASASSPALEPLNAAAEKDTVAAPVVPVVASAPAVVPVTPAAPVEEEVVVKPIEQPKPEFPEDVMAQLGSGKVKLRFMVQPDGSVAEAEVLSTSHRRLNRAALDAIAKWRFKPIKVARPAQVELGFSLE